MTQKTTSQEFSPLIVALCCNECSYGAADLAGTSRMITPPNVHIIRIPCTGRVDILHILEALRDGADGVLVAGCLIGDCHYEDGNLHAERMIIFLKKVLDEIGFGGDRVSIKFMSSSMASEWQKVSREFTDQIRKLGPNPYKVKEEK